MPGSSVELYLVGVTTFVQICAEIASPTLTTLFAAPVEVLVVPVTIVRYFVPAGHFPTVFWVVYFSVIVVVPLPFFHVSFDVRLPVSLLIGTVTFDVPPALSVAGVHMLQFDEVVPVLFVVLIVVVAASFEHTTLDAADADWASGRANPVAAIAVAAHSAPSFESFTEASPLVGMVFPSRQKIVANGRSVQ